MKSEEKIGKAEFNQMRLKNVKPARAHGLSKIYKTITNITKFRPIIDTTVSSHYLVGKCLAQLLYPLTNNEFTLKDSFEAVNRIKISVTVSRYQDIQWNSTVEFCIFELV